MKVAFLIFSYQKDSKPNMPIMFHTLLFANEMKEKGDEVKILLEGEAVNWAKDLLSENHPLKNHFEKLKENFVVCEACSDMFKIKDEIKGKLELENDLFGHISLKKYLDEGYRVIEL
ncbi:DsrE family protein [Methanocaldococcus infernus]